MNKYLSAILLVLMTQRLYADIVVIDPSTLNGSYESGILSPWGWGTVVSNTNFAAEGQYYLQAVEEQRADVFQFFPAVSSSMPNFTLSFRVRNGDPAFPTINGSLSARRTNGTFINASVVQSSTPIPTNTEWSLYSYVLAFTEEWDESKTMKVSIFFGDAESVAVGYVDDVRVTQITDPTCIRDFTVVNGDAMLSIQHIAPSNTYWIQRSFDLIGDNWLSVSNLNLAYPGAEWSEELSNQWEKVFYRLKQE